MSVFRQFAALLVALCLGFAPHPALAVLKAQANAPGLTNAASVGITGGTIDGSSLDSGSGIPTILGKSSIPFIHISSGSIAANGAISGITALNRAIPRAYCWFPANAVATVAAAGWRYCTFSTTTAGVAFLDTYSSGQPTIPSSPTAVTDGKGAYTSDTAEHTGPTYNMPASAMGANGQILTDTYWHASGAGGTKTPKVKIGGTTLQSSAIAQANFPANVRAFFANQGNTSAQVSNALLFVAGGMSNAQGVGTEDTGTILAVARTLTKAVATDNFILEGYTDLLLSDGT